MIFTAYIDDYTIFNVKLSERRIRFKNDEIGFKNKNIEVSKQTGKT